MLVGLLGLGTAFWALRDSSEVTVIGTDGLPQATPTTLLPTEPAPSAPAQTNDLSASQSGNHSALLEMDIPTGFAPPELQTLSFTDAFAQAAAYRGWRCGQTEVILFSQSQQAVPAVQEQLLNLGYQVTPTEAALGEDESWLAHHASKSTLFGSFSTGEEGRGNVSVCATLP